MELITKLREGKPPLIAIVFPTYGEASMTNSQLPDSHKDVWYTITLEHYSEKIILTVANESRGIKCRYEVEKFSSIELHRFLAKTPGMKQINFAHLTIKNDKLESVITAYCKPWVIAVNRITYFIKI